MEILTGDTINISEWTECDFYGLYWYWDYQNDKAESGIGRWIGVSHLVGSTLCYWVLIEKWKIIARTNVQHVTQDEAEKPEIQQSISNYHMTLESAIGEDEFMSDLDRTDSFINKEVLSL